MDDADIADREIQRELERGISLVCARIPQESRRYCVDCGEDLEPHRQPWGICIECKQIREDQTRMRGYL